MCEAGPETVSRVVWDRRQKAPDAGNRALALGEGGAVDIPGALHYAELLESLD